MGRLLKAAALPAGWRWCAAAALLLALILVPFLLWERAFTALGQGLVGGAGAASRPAVAAAIVALLAADVVLPVPSSLVSAGAAAMFGWAGGALIWLGMTLGAVAGYALGRGAGRPLGARLLGRRELERAERIAGGGSAGATLVLCRAVPVLAEASTVAAGLGGMAVGRFLAVTGAANAGIALVYAGAGSLASDYAGGFLLPFGAAMVLPALGWAAIRTSRRRPAR